MKEKERDDHGKKSEKSTKYIFQCILLLGVGLNRIHNRTISISRIRPVLWIQGLYFRSNKEGPARRTE